MHLYRSHNLPPPTIIVYIIERAIRIYRGTQTVKLVQAIQHPSRVIELRMQKANFKYRPGQWLYLNMPYLAYHVRIEYL